MGYIGISSSLCPTNNDLHLQGNSYSGSTFQYFEITLQRCDPGSSTCESAANIDAEIPNVGIDVTVVNSYFDFDDYEQPVKTFLDDRFLYTLLPGYSVNTDVYLRKNKAEVQDGFFYYTPNGEELEFVGFQRVDTKYSVSTGDGASLFGMYSPSYTTTFAFSLLV